MDNDYDFQSISILNAVVARISVGAQAKTKSHFMDNDYDFQSISILNAAVARISGDANPNQSQRRGFVCRTRADGLFFNLLVCAWSFSSFERYWPSLFLVMNLVVCPQSHARLI